MPDTAPISAIALSGGGPWGAYGAGFLNAWGKNGIPVFDHVSGVSTGALQAPFVFLGGDHLNDLETLYRTIGNEGVLRKRAVPLAVLFKSGLNSAAPLRRSVLRALEDGRMIEAIAESSGRTLTVGVVDLDAGRLVGGDLVAASRHALATGNPGCVADLMVASAAVPVYFDPVVTEGGGRPYGRLLADGGVHASVFIDEFEFTLRTLGREAEMERSPLDNMVLREDAPPHRASLGATDIFIIVNGKIGIAPERTSGNVVALGLRTVSNLVDQVALDSLYRLTRLATRPDYCIRATYVRADFDPCEGQGPDCKISTNTTNFDRGFMGRLADDGAAQWAPGGRPFRFEKGCAVPAP